MSIRYIFNTSGEYVAFIDNNNVFDPNCEWLGFITNGNEAYRNDGMFLGYVLEDDRIARNTSESEKPYQPTPPTPYIPNPSIQAVQTPANA